MLMFIVIALTLITACTLFAMLGSRLGAKMEEKNLGAGTVESSMNEGMSASVLGGLLGIIPFLLFVVALVITVITNPAHPEDASGSSGAPTASH